MENQLQHSSNFGPSKIFSYCLWALLFILPILVIPSQTISLYSAKFTFLATITILFIAGFMAVTLSSGVLKFPRIRFLLPLILFPIIAIISSLIAGSFGGSSIQSIAGEVFELGTSGSLVLLSLLTFVAMLAVRKDLDTGMKAMYAFMLSAIVVIVHLIIRIFAGSIPAVLASKIPNFLVGGSTDTAIFLGGMIIVSLCALNLLSLSKRMKYVVYASLFISMLFIGGVGFLPVIIVLGLFSLIYFVYGLSWRVGNREGEHFKVGANSFPSLFVLAISVIFVLSGTGLGGYLSNVFNINSIEIRPDVSSTLSLVKESWKANPLFGVGPNRFSEVWDKYKPVDVNQTQFWSTQFTSGSGFVPTVAVTTGILGLLALLSFLFLYVKTGLKAIFSNTAGSPWRFLTSASFFVSLFFWIEAIVYVPNITILALGFIFTGIFASTLVPQEVSKEIEINIFSNPKTNFLSVFVIVILLIVSITLGYFVWERTVASSLFGKGAITLSNGDAQTARVQMAKAISLVPTDTYWRGFSEASVVLFNQAASTISSPDRMSETDRANLQAIIADAIESAQGAINWNGENYNNWFTLARVYESFANAGIEGAVDNARAAYAEAEIRSPSNPAIPLGLARLDALMGKLPESRANIEKAISLKSNYTEAYFALAQLEAASNNIPGAIRNVESATLVDPNNTGLYFQLGLLKYDTRDFAGASKAFERAVALVPDYANARYFLGLSYYNMDKNTEALAQFEEIQKSNPDNAEVKLIISNLKANKDPFSGAKPPVDNSPEDREELPIDEDEAN